MLNAPNRPSVNTTEAAVEAVYHDATVGLAQSDLNGRFIIANPRYCEIVGHTEHELKSVRVHDITHAEDRAHKDSIFNEVIQTGKALNTTKRYIRADKSIAWAEDTVSLLKDDKGRPHGFLIICNQIEEQKYSWRMQHIYEGALTNTPDFVYVIGLDGRFIYANKALLEMWGHTATTAFGRSFTELGYEQWHAEMHNQEIAQVIATKKAVRGEVPFAGVKERRIYDYIFAPIFDENGNVSAIAGTTRDITENKEAQEVLRESEEHKKFALKASEYIGTFDYNPISGLLVADERFARMYSVDPEWAAKGAPLEEFTKTIHPDDMLHLAPAIEDAVAKGGEFSSEYRLVPPDGPMHWVVARGRVDKNADGVAFKFGGAVVDITERKLAEERLKHSEQQFRKLTDALLSNTADFNYVFDLEGRFTYINKALLDLLQKSFDEVIGRNFFELQYPHELAERLQRQIQQVITTKQPVKDETPYTSASGTRAYEYIFKPIIGENGNVEAVAGSTRDITEYKEADRRKDEFLAMLAHELRNPLAPISNAIHFMRAPSVSEERREEAAQLVDRQITQMTNLLNDLLDVSRVTLGKIELRPQKVALSDIINMAVESTQPLIDERGQLLQISVPKTPIWLNADTTRLSQVFSNLLNNAAKYTEKGGHIEIKASKDKSEVLVQITDNGIGIPKEVQPHIFELFAQVDSSMERAHGGLGIGLTLVKNLVEMHTGSVTVFSEGKGKGSTFTVCLPAQADIQDHDKTTVSALNANTAIDARRILVVDDNEASAKTLGWTLELLGHEIQLAHEGQKVLEAARSYKPDIILLDIGLPGMNGYEVCEALRKEPLFKNTVVIAQTGWGQKEHLDRAQKAGFDYHLVKPIKIEDLRQILEKAKDLRKITA